MWPLSLSCQSPCYTARHAHTHAKTNGSTVSYFNHPPSLLTWRCRRISSSNVFCQNIENMGGYGDLCSFFSRPERSTGHMNALKDMVADGGVPNTSSSSPLMETCDRIEIVKFLRGKNYFITGATGFLAKVWLEKMLRSVRDAGKIFLLIKAKDKETAMDRLKNEIIGTELFKCLEQMHGESYADFMMSKLVPVVGNICESNLGMDATSTTEIAEAVDVIVNSAANTIFDERYDVALNTNTKGPSRLLSFAKKCKKPILFVHVSTAYVNREREGVVSEKPFCNGESIAGERATSETSSISFPVLDVDAEIELASHVVESLQGSEVTQKMKELGFERARIHGWQNTYSFTKAMGEMLINSMKGDIPVVILRPSIIESTYREPFPGWIEGNRMMDPLILSYGKGQLPGLLCDPKAVIDVVPADMVVNATMAATAKHGNAGKPGLHVYHIASSVANPLVLSDVFKFSCNHFNSFPFMDSKGKRIDIAGMKYFSSMDAYSSYIENEIVRQSGLMDATNSDQKLHQTLQLKCRRKAEHVLHMVKIYEPYMFYRGRFDNRSTQKLMEDVSGEEMRNFGFDVRDVDWKDYIVKTHIPGLRRHVLKGR